MRKNCERALLARSPFLAKEKIRRFGAYALANRYLSTFDERAGLATRPPCRSATDQLEEAADASVGRPVLMQERQLRVIELLEEVIPADLLQ